jgi:phage tail protein X
MTVLGSYVVREDQERIDRIARAIYGEEGNGAVELLLTANPELASKSLPDGPGILPFGTVLIVPERPVTSPARLTRPWE